MITLRRFCWRTPLPEGKIVWRYPQVGRGNSWGGTLTTACTDLVVFYE